VQIGYVEQFVSHLRGEELRIGLEASRAGMLGSDFGAVSGTVIARGYFPEDGSHPRVTREK